MLKVGIISQARMTSSRLPGKILLEAGGKSMLWHHINRLKKSGLPIIIATTVNKTDDVIVEFCKKENISYYRGSECDVLSRYYECAKENKLDVIVRVTSDCPLIDGEILRKCYEEHIKQLDENFYLSNGLERSFPRGMDFEIFSFKLLKEANENAKFAAHREHVTPYLYTNRLPNVKYTNCKFFTDKSRIRITLDEEKDFELIKLLIEDFNAHEKNCSEIVQIFKDYPALYEINKNVEQKKDNYT